MAVQFQLGHREVANFEAGKVLYPAKFCGISNAPRKQRASSSRRVATPDVPFPIVHSSTQSASTSLFGGPRYGLREVNGMVSSRVWVSRRYNIPTNFRAVHASTPAHTIVARKPSPISAAKIIGTRWGVSEMLVAAGSPLSCGCGGTRNTVDTALLLASCHAAQLSHFATSKRRLRLACKCRAAGHSASSNPRMTSAAQN